MATVVIPGATHINEITRLKETEGSDILIWGTGQLTDALATAGLLDEYRICTSLSSKEPGNPCFAPPAQAPSNFSTPKRSPAAQSSTPTAHSNRNT
jgi:dihydrofolate reductase